MGTPVQETRTSRFFDRMSRRAAMIGGAAGLVTAGAGRVTAQDATPAAEGTPGASEPVGLLFVQNAGATTLEPGPGDVYTLTMTNVLRQTLYFSDRPARITGAEPTERFVETFSTAFASSPPNATLIGHLEVGASAEDAVVLTLLSATYEPRAAALVYEVQPLDLEAVGRTTFEREPLTVLDAPHEYAEVHLFIDDDADLALCDLCARESMTLIASSLACIACIADS